MHARERVRIAPCVRTTIHCVCMEDECTRGVVVSHHRGELCVCSRVSGESEPRTVCVTEDGRVREARLCLTIEASSEETHACGKTSATGAQRRIMLVQACDAPCQPCVNGSRRQPSSRCTCWLDQPARTCEGDGKIKCSPLLLSIRTTQTTRQHEFTTTLGHAICALCAASRRADATLSYCSQSHMHQQRWCGMRRGHRLGQQRSHKPVSIASASPFQSTLLQSGHRHQPRHFSGSGPKARRGLPGGWPADFFASDGGGFGFSMKSWVIPKIGASPFPNDPEVGISAPGNNE